MLLAIWTSDIIPVLFFEQDAERLVFAPDLVSVVAASAACVALTVACGLMPLLEIRDDARRPCSAAKAPVRRRPCGASRAGLVVTQMSCCCVLVISTGLLVQGFRTALQTRPLDRVWSVDTGHGSITPRASGSTISRRSSRRRNRQRASTALAWVGRLPATGRSGTRYASSLWACRVGKSRSTVPRSLATCCRASPCRRSRGECSPAGTRLRAAVS